MGENEKKYQDIINFIKETENLKNILRSGYTSNKRPESTAEHSWRLALFAMMLEDEFSECDSKRVLELCLIHDLGELYDGDIPAYMEVDPVQKLEQERKAIHKLSSFLPEQKAAKFSALWEEYNACETKESKFVKALDKIETIIQHNQGDNPEGFDYEFNIDYGKALCVNDDRLLTIRKITDAETIDNARSKQKKML